MAGLTRPERLSNYLQQAARTPFDWGGFDCAAGFAAGWVIEERGVDPAQGLRGTYAGPLQAMRLLRREGGLQACIDQRAKAIGIHATTSPVLGDVGLVWASGRRKAVQVMAIRTARRWAFLGAKGIIIAPADLIEAWAV